MGGKVRVMYWMYWIEKRKLWRCFSPEGMLKVLRATPNRSIKCVRVRSMFEIVGERSADNLSKRKGVSTNGR